VLFRLAHTLYFDATTQDRALLDALQTVLAHEDAHGDWLPATVEVDLSFASEQWQRIILVRTDRGRRIARRHFEVCVFSNLANALKSGDVAVRASDAFADYRGQLLSWSECEPRVAEYCQELGIPSFGPTGGSSYIVEPTRLISTATAGLFVGSAEGDGLLCETSNPAAGRNAA
jgi:hypothetical protein